MCVLTVVITNTPAGSAANVGKGITNANFAEAVEEFRKRVANDLLAVDPLANTNTVTTSLTVT
jgi:hypothetical protein